MKKYITALIIPFIIASMLTSCAFSPGGDSPEAEPVETPETIWPETPEEPEAPISPATGGSIKIDCRNPKTFNPILNEDLSVDRLLRLIYEPLVALDERHKPRPAVASSWDFSADGLTLTLHIRENALWEDGEEITAEDVKYTLDTINASPETSLYNLCLTNVLEYYAADSKTFVISYEKPFGNALYNLTFPVIPKHHFSAARPGNEVTEPLGSGLYKLERFETMREAVLSASPSSFRGRANITEIVALIVRDSDSPLYAYDQKLLDIVETKRADWKKVSASRQSNIFMNASTGYEFLALNFRNETLKEVNFRKALAHAVPKEEIIDKIYAGNAFSATTPINPQSWLRETGINEYEYSPEKAKEYLRLSSYSSYGIQPLRILVNNDNEERMLTAERIVSEFEAIGIVCEIELRDFEDYSYRLLGGYFDIALCGFEMSIAPDLTPFFGSIGGVLGKHNFIAYKDDVMDGYLVQAEISVYEAAQLSAYSNIQKHFSENLPYISLFYKANVVLTGKEVFGEVKSVINNAYNNIGELYLER